MKKVGTKRRNGASRKPNSTPLFKETQRIIDRVEEEIGIPFLTYWTSPVGGVCSNDVLVLYEVLQRIGSHPGVALFIKSDGGEGLSSLLLVNLLRQYAQRITALIPVNCASAATLIALGADEIQMGPIAYLTAVDTALTHPLSPTDLKNELVSVSLDELQRVITLWKRDSGGSNEDLFKTLYQYVHPLVIGAIDRASSLSRRLCQEILSYHLQDEPLVERIAQTLNAEFPSHSYPITLPAAQKLGLNAQPLPPTLNSLLLELNSFYSEIGQRATKDFAEWRSHSNEIVNIIEARNLRAYFQNDKEWYYLKEERRWEIRNDFSSWYKIERSGRETTATRLHIM